MIRIAMRSALIAALATLAACGTTKNATETGGAVKPGGLFGKALGTGGSQAVIIHSMRGGLIGGSVGAGLDEDERSRGLEAEYRALEYSPAGQPVTWKGNDSATYGEAAAAQPYRVGSQDCRQYTQTVFRNGQSKVARGTACRNPDGSWTPLT